MCDSICKNEKKFVLGPAPSPCTTMEDYAVFEPAANPAIKNIVQETTIHVPKIEYKEKVVHVPKVEYRTYPVLKDVEAPIYQERYRYKDVQVPQKKFRVKPVYKVVDVPQYKYVNKYVKRKYKRFQYVPKEVPVPFRPRREIYTEIPIRRYIPQYMENGPIQPDMHNSAYNPQGELPLFEGYNHNFLNMMNPFSRYNGRKKDNCFLSCLCNGKNDESLMYEMDPLLFSDVAYTHGRDNLCDVRSGYEISPEPYSTFAYNSYPLVIHKRENNLYNRMIETTSNLLAAAGVALVLAGRLGLQGISLLVGSADKGKGAHKGSHAGAAAVAVAGKGEGADPYALDGGRRNPLKDTQVKEKQIEDQSGRNATKSATK
ncbi:inner membrane complex protein 1m, putative [Plasmodium vivax]|nr:inner membrane complex protein 1m, putative [Plasmodium vivax]